jgi:hypothetical protein
MARERREGTARDIGERKGENCNIVMIFLWNLGRDERSS